MSLWRRSFAAKVVVASAALIGLLGLFTMALVLTTTQRHMAAVDQGLNRGLAARIVAELPPPQAGTRAVDPAALFTQVMAINPTTEVYLLDPNGRILRHAAPPGRVRLEAVAIEPVRQLLAADLPLPVYGDDPREPGRRKVFSAAPIGTVGEPSGYLYVILGGEAYRTLAAMLAGNRVLRLTLAVLAGAVLLALVSGFLASRLLTRRLRLLAAAMARFERQGFRVPQPLMPSVPQHQGGDELDELTRSFAVLAERVADQLASLERVDETRRELVTSISHDLKTPLTALQGYLETLLLRWEQLPAEQRQAYIQFALGFSQRLGQMIADLFELARLDLGEAPLRLEVFPLDDLVQDLCQELRHEAELHGITLEAPKAALGRFVEGDIRLIERALANLLDNAIKFTPMGGVVSVAVREASGWVAVEVSDTGIGIDAAELPSIFDRFYRAGALSSETPGAGLGLAIVKRIAELHGGMVRAESRLGEGSTFVLELPARS